MWNLRDGAEGLFVFKRAFLCYRNDVKLYSTIGHFLAACLIAGLFFAPLTASRAAQANTCPMMMDGMDCCPNKPARTTCPKCPLMALCMSNVVVRQDPHVAIVTITAVVVRNLVPSDEPVRTGLAYAPPSRPPRVLA